MQKKCRNEKRTAFTVAKKKKERFLIVHGPGGKKGKLKNIYMTWKGKLSRVTLMIMFHTHQRGLTEESTPTDIGLQDNIQLQPETTRESPSIENQDMSHLPERKEQSQSPNTNVNLPLRTGQSISKEIQNTNHATSGSSNGHVRDTSWLNILAFCLKHNVTGALMEDLLKLLRLCSGDAVSIPRSKYMLEKAFKDFVDKSEYHHYCGVCSSYIGLSVSKDSELKYQICSSTQTVEQSLEFGNFFICIPLRDQFKALLENEPITHIHNDQNRDGITDISDGKLYKYLKSVSDSFFSLPFNCDGVPVFQSSKFSIWPLLCSVNEVHPEERDKNVILCALWFGSSKPLMTSFLKPFVEECKSLGQTGLQWQDPVDHSIKTTMVYALCAICDAVAQPLLQNFKQFNGEYGCGHCLHPGVQVRKGNGTVRVYPCLGELPELRDHNTTVQIGEIAKHNEHSILGIRGPSPVVDLPNFDLINGMVPDYMHCVLLEVCRQIASLWFDSKNCSQPWYIGLNTARVDGNLLAIKPPSIFS